MFIPAIAFTGSYYIARCADQGLADFLGLQTLRHGTNPISWLSIHIFGAMPAMGGSSIGGDKGFCDHQNRNYFYTQGDVKPQSSYNDTLFNRGFDKFCQYTTPKTYAVSGTFNLVSGGNFKNFIEFGQNHPKVGPILTICAAPIFAAGMVLPTIKFRISDKKIKKMERDTTVPGAFRTHEWQNPLRIGLIGTIWASCTFKTPIRMYKHPHKVMKGVALLAISGVAAAYCVTTFAPLIATHQIVILAGAALAFV